MLHPVGRFSPLRARRTPFYALVLTGVLASAVLTAAPGSAADPYPSWDDIQQAKSSESAKAAEAEKLEGLLTDLRKDAGSLGDAAVEAANRHNEARDALAASDKELAALAAQREAAAQQSDELMRQVAGLAAETYKSGGSAADSMTLMLLDTDASADALHGADLMDRVSSRAGNLYAGAVASEKVADGFREQEQEARNARAKLAAEAEKALQEAGASAAAAGKAVQDEEARKAVLLAQLADLHGSTAAAEEARLRGIAAEKAFQEQHNAAERAAAGGTVPKGQQPANPPVGTAPNPPGAQPPEVAVPAPQPAPAPAPAPVQPAPPPAPAPGQPVNDPAGAQNYASGRMGDYGWDGNEFRCLVILWNHESNWLTTADNPYSDAYGIPQSLPGSNMSSHGADWQTNYRTQVSWGLDYIKSRYGTPCAAYAFWQRNNWY
ncbi:lytic transglycosylase domain-containing protein [Arthrobacter sp. zg-Y1171]|uniref:coiled-coil domain-containing protein n=1 Tax=Arthrobacter sp. zg-Y1171 TaxID=2964610 RepID=UPI002104E0CA|nr:lytic transglycosylase domain-containing protein [Arthrobacter sp. zg-Y1171]MCQ1996052.1 lytic transglycosylase domain-containing protein [Arthrobacter sp. zg-Y1171]UWX82878.1 lytic transglycosylase domain-containing protein [Arthrobacter sp. zg-Y1171]